MSNLKNIVIVEDRLQEMFNILPTVQSFQPTFGYGDKKELNAFIKNQRSSRDFYPLIWLLYPYVEDHNKTDVYIDKLDLILACNTNAVDRNEKRLQEAFKKVLYPLADNIVTLFNRANIVNWKTEFKIVKHPNYASNESKDEHAGTFIWDALKFTTSLSITDDCLKQIRF